MSDYSNDPHKNPYWQNLNGQNNQGWENRQNTRNNDPHWHPEENLGFRLGKTASTLGFCSLILGLILPIILPFVLGTIAILLAVISKGRGSTYTKNARNGLITGTVAIAVNLAVVIYCVVSFFGMMGDPGQRQEFSSILEDTYGYSLKDALDYIGGDYGISIEESGADGYL